MSEKELLELEKQLSNPQGKQGVEVANKMNASNFSMTCKTIDFLKIKDKFIVLELGHGNCGHLSEVVKKAKNLNYYGLEVSKLMQQEAIRLNPNYKDNFKLYDGIDVPFESNYFDRIFTVNTIYFWKNPQRLIQEIERILKPNGLCVISFAKKKFMETLPFVKNEFTLYERAEIEKLLVVTNLKIVDYQSFSEDVVSKSGESVCREYAVVSLTN